MPERSSRRSTREFDDKALSFLLQKTKHKFFSTLPKVYPVIPCVSNLWKRNARGFLFFLFFIGFALWTPGDGVAASISYLQNISYATNGPALSWSRPFRQKRVVGPANTAMHLQRIISRGRSGTNDSTNGERKPTALPAMPLHLYSGHWNNLFRFLITEARSGTPRENANAAEALALLDCRFYHMLRTYDTHCHEYTHTSLPHLLSIGSISARPYVVYSLWDYFIKKLKPDRKQINGFCL